MKITANQIHRIAQELDMGLDVYINRETGEVRSILDPEDLFSEGEIWEEEIKKIEKEWDDYVVLKKMDSFEAFGIMEAFVHEVDDERLQDKLVDILERRRPFSNFRAAIDDSLYRERWFAFKDGKYQEYVRKLLETEGIEFES
ncbi:MAG: hypothetical protein GXO83_12230 [Chlorobi bacterium]|nr:hypothetical protein [Chlorobiota bacterium]